MEIVAEVNSVVARLMPLSSGTVSPDDVWTVLFVCNFVGFLSVVARLT